jgi:tetratricopeptide (TPR) repeat protein
LVLRDLGNLYRASKQYQEAAWSFERCLSYQEKFLRPDHPLMIETLQSYGALLRSMGRKAEARRIEKRAGELAKREAREDPTGLMVDVATLRALR